jgi:hypothetical protein
MLNTRNSRRRSHKFRSVFRDGPRDFPLRQLRRCREDFYAGVLQTAVWLALLVAIALFGRTLAMVFHRHGRGLNPWVGRTVLFGLAVLILAGLVRIWRRVQDLRDLWLEMGQYRRQLDDSGDE